MRFRSRTDAGRRLGAALEPYRGSSTLVLGLPRGGVPVAVEVARTLEAPVDVWVVRKLGVPGQPELGMGAVSEGGAVYLSPEVIEGLGITDQEIEAVLREETPEVERRVRRFRGDRPPPEVTGRTVIVVDDGIATGGTVHAAVLELRRRAPERLVLATPVVAAETVAALRPEVDDLVYLQAPTRLYSIGAWYEDFHQVPDEEVLELLESAREPAGHAPAQPS